MAFSEKLANKIRKALGHRSDVEEKKMFRGIAFMVDGKMCITVGDDRMMCRIDPAIHDEVVKAKGCSTMTMKNREYKGYVLVGPEGMKTKKDFDYWINLALDFNKFARASKPKKKATAKKKK